MLTCWWRRERKFVDINAADLGGCDVGLNAKQGLRLEEREKLAEYESIRWGTRAGQQDEHQRSYDGTFVLHDCPFRIPITLLNELLIRNVDHQDRFRPSLSEMFLADLGCGNPKQVRFSWIVHLKSMCHCIGTAPAADAIRLQPGITKYTFKSLIDSLDYILLG